MQSNQRSYKVWLKYTNQYKGKPEKNTYKVAKIYYKNFNYIEIAEKVRSQLKVSFDKFDEADRFNDSPDLVLYELKLFVPSYKQIRKGLKGLQLTYQKNS